VTVIAELFEFLDEDRTGMIEAKDLLSALETS
jgi:Ca2+-binding EF-hand superfamily protein